MNHTCLDWIVVDITIHFWYETSAAYSNSVTWVVEFSENNQMGLDCYKKISKKQSCFGWTFTDWTFFPRVQISIFLRQATQGDHIRLLHRGAICQFPVRWIYYSHSNKSTGKKTGKTHLLLIISVYDNLFLCCKRNFFEQHWWVL